MAEADLRGVRVPIRQDDGTYKDAEGRVMQRADMADYFDRLRRANAAAAALAEARQETADAMDEEEAAPAAVRPRLAVHKSQPRGAMRRTNPMKH